MKALIIEPEVLAKLATYSRTQQLTCWQAIGDLPGSFGRPHAHTGLSIRKLRPKLFEFRAGSETRLLFRDEHNGLYVGFVGNHDEVQQVLKSGKLG
jgi:hypothetical protein